MRETTRRPRIITVTVKRMRWLAQTISSTEQINTVPFADLVRDWSTRLYDWAKDLDATDARETKPDPSKRPKRKKESRKGAIQRARRKVD